MSASRPALSDAARPRPRLQAVAAAKLIDSRRDMPPNAASLAARKAHVTTVLRALRQGAKIERALGKAAPLFDGTECTFDDGTRAKALLLHRQTLPLPADTHPSIKRLCVVTACMSGSEDRNDDYVTSARNLFQHCPFPVVVWTDLANVIALVGAARDRLVGAGTLLLIVDTVYRLPLVGHLGGWEWARRQPRLSKFWSQVHGTGPYRMMDYSSRPPAAFAAWVAKPSVRARKSFESALMLADAALRSRYGLHSGRADAQRRGTRSAYRTVLAYRSSTLQRSSHVANVRNSS